MLALLIFFTQLRIQESIVRDDPRWHTNINFDVSGDLHFTGELYKNGSVINTGGAQGAQGSQGFQGPANGYQGAVGAQGADGINGTEGYWVWCTRCYWS